MDPDRVAIIDAIGGSLDDAAAPLQRFEHTVQPWVTYGILPVFGLFNAGVAIDATVLRTLPTAVPLGIIFGLVRGKPGRTRAGDCLMLRRLSRDARAARGPPP